MANTAKLPAAGQGVIRFHPGLHGLPEVRFLGIHDRPRAQKGLVPHLHPGVMEICYLVRGEVVFNVGGRDYALKGNDVFWTHADEAHGSGHNIYGRSLLYWTQISLPERPARFLTLSGRDAWPLVRELRRLPARRFRGSRRLRTLFEEACSLCRQPASPLARLGLATRIVEWLRTVAECSRRGAAPRASADIGAALALVDRRAEEAPTIAEMAAAAHLSLSRFKTKFREQVGMAPGEYVLRRRVELARRLLAEGRASVTEIAYRLGFSSSQYFAHVFRRFMHVRPSDVRKTAAAGRGSLPPPVTFRN